VVVTHHNRAERRRQAREQEKVQRAAETAARPKRDRQRVIANTREMLAMARAGLADAVGGDPTRRRAGVMNLFSYGRSVTHAIQTMKNVDPAFEAWWAPYQAKLGLDPLVGSAGAQPVDAADPPQSRRKSDGVHCWDAESVHAFLDVSRGEDDRLFPLWALLATTGMRRGEALGLRWSDIDLETGRATLVADRQPSSGSLIDTALPIWTSVCRTRPSAADARRATPGRQRLQRPRPCVPPTRRLVAPRNTAMLRGSSPGAVSQTFLRRVGQYELPRLTLHGLRHTWATLALERGIHPRVVQERLGHSTIAITLVSTVTSPTLHDEAAQLIADLMLPPARPVALA